MNVLIYHTLADSLGGAELVLIHVMNYFLSQPGTTVTVLGFQAPDLQKMKEFSGIDLPQDRVFSVQPVMPRYLKIFPQGLFLIKAAVLQKKAKELAPHYDLCISTCNEVDFGKQALQYMHHPQLVGYKLLRKYKIIHEKSLLNRYPFISLPYLIFVQLLSGNRKYRIEKNLSFANSHFMRGVIAEAYNIDATVIYPSLVDLDILRPQAGVAKKMRMICVGRIHSDKGTRELVDLFAAIHARVPTLELVIAGKVTDTDYYDSVRARADMLNVPITFMVNISREEVQELLKTSLIFINPKQYEHFGIATVEAIAAGCLPFVHASGGSVEIVPISDLQYQNAEELVAKVEKLTTHQLLQKSLHKALQDHLAIFSTAEFYRHLDLAVSSFRKGQQAAYSRSPVSQPPDLATGPEERQQG